MTHGALTARLGDLLSQELSRHAIDVLYDHGQTAENTANNVGRVVSWFGTVYEAESRLAFVDIAVVARDTGKAIVLIEIEETTDKPKVLIGDVLAILLGDGVKFRGKQNVFIGTWTTLIVLGHSSSSRHQRRTAFLGAQANQLKSYLTARNAAIGQIVIDLYDNATELEAKLREQIQRARERASVLGSQ